MNKIRSLLLIGLAILSLSGCTSINKVDEEKVKDVSDKITETIINTVDNKKAERHESHTINAENLNTLNIKSSVGEIKINTHESKDAIIDLNIVANMSSTEKSQELVDEFTYTVDQNLNSLNINTAFNDSALEKYNVSTNLTISVPANIDNLIISLSVGDIHIENINGKLEVSNNVGGINVENSNASYNLKTNVGEINVIDAAAIDKSELITNTGEIKASFNDIQNAESIKAVTNIGDIDIAVPENSSYEAVINEFMEKERSESNKDKYTKLEIKADMGQIEFKKH